MPYTGSRRAIESVLVKLGVDLDERLGQFDQDPEYTACRSEELADYLRLYRSGTLSLDERAVLACFMLESLNEVVAAEERDPLEQEVLGVLFATNEHAKELASWTDTSDPDESNWWPLTRVLLEFRRAKGSAQSLE